MPRADPLPALRQINRGQVRHTLDEVRGALCRLDKVVDGLGSIAVLGLQLSLTKMVAELEMAERLLRPLSGGATEPDVQQTASAAAEDCSGDAAGVGDRLP